MSNFECVCGYKGNHGHVGGCRKYSEEVVRVKEAMVLYIADVYKANYSVTECCSYVKDKEKTTIFESALRKMITQYLDSLGIREKLDGKTLNDNRQAKMRATMLERYGVENAGQLEGNGRKAANKIPYVKLKLNQEFTEYRAKVEKLSWHKLGMLKKTNSVPSECYYTGITFNDNVLEKVNPNDPYKRTLDHKTSVSEAFFRGWSVEKVMDDSNIVFCLRIVNTVKGHLNESDFRRLLLPLLKKRLEDENKIS